MPLSLTIGATGRHSWLLVDVLEEDLEPCWNDAEKRGAEDPTFAMMANFIMIGRVVLVSFATLFII